MKRSLLAWPLAASLLSPGCTAEVPLSPEQQIAAATAQDAPIAFRVEGESPDSGEAAPDVLTMAAAVRLALAHDPGVQAALARARIAAAEADQAGLLPNPLLSVAVRYPTGGGRPTIDAGVAQDILSLLQRPRLNRAAAARLGAAAAESVSAVLDSLASVQEAYVAAQSLDAQREELFLRRGALERVLDVAQARLSAGEGTVLEVMAAEGKVAAVESEVASNELGRAEKRLTLVRLLGSPTAATGFRLTPWRPEHDPVPADGRWVDAALANRPELRGAEWGLRALRAEQGISWLTLFDGADVGADSERDDGDWSVGPAVSLPIPLFDFGQARRERARAAVSEASHKLTAIRREVIEQVRTAHAAYLASGAALEAANSKLVPLAERRVEQAEAQYRAGEAAQSDVLLAEEDRSAAAARRIELETQQLSALIRLERAVGGPAAFARVTDPPRSANDTPATEPKTEEEQQ